MGLDPNTRPISISAYFELGCFGPILLKNLVIFKTPKLETTVEIERKKVNNFENIINFKRLRYKTYQALQQKNYM